LESVFITSPVNLIARLDRRLDYKSPYAATCVIRWSIQKSCTVLLFRNFENCRNFFQSM